MSPAATSPVFGDRPGRDSTPPAPHAPTTGGPRANTGEFQDRRFQTPARQDCSGTGKPPPAGSATGRTQRRVGRRKDAPRGVGGGDPRETRKCRGGRRKCRLSPPHPRRVRPPPAEPPTAHLRTHLSSPRGPLCRRRPGTGDLRPGGRERSGGRTAARSPRVPTSGPAARRVLTQIAEAPGEEPTAARPTAPASSRGGFDLPGRAPSAPFPEGECAPPAPRLPPHIVAGMPPPPPSPSPRGPPPWLRATRARPIAFFPSLQLPNPPAPGFFPRPNFFVAPPPAAPGHNLEV